ncbi:hypothetical protein FJTKL_02621 [Diaporthe vaccinii]|uniref:Uncharacterized protein n=2 Tax=Diaporthe vaccinii TaxID=105482 RepID=A0ABR4DXQ5_9PEZI
MYSLVQLFTFGLAVSTAASGFQVSAAGNVGLSRRVAGQALMAFVVPALAVPLENPGVAPSRNSSSAVEPDCDDEEADQNDDESDQNDDESDQNDDESDQNEDDNEADEDDEADEADEDDEDEDEDDE